YTARAEFHGRDLGEPAYTPFAGRVGGGRVRALQAVDRGDVDDCAPAALDDARCHGLDPEERPDQVDAQHALEVLLGNVQKAPHQQDPRVVDEDVDATEACHGLLHHAPPLLLVGYVVMPE